MATILDQYEQETNHLIAIAESTEHRLCQFTGEPMMLQVFNSDEAKDNIEIGLPGAQYACWCNGGHYVAID